MKKVLVVCHMGRHYKKFGHYDIIPLLEMGYTVHFAANFTLSIDKVEDDRIILHQIDFIRNPFSLKNINAYFQMKKLLENEKYDMIHCQSPVGGAITRLAAKNTMSKSAKIFYTAHGFHFYKGAPIINWLLFYPIEKYLAKYTDTLITINKEDYNLALKKFNKRCNDIQYIPGVGIDPKKFDFELSVKEKHNLRKSLGLQDDDFVMIYPARLDKNKNQIMLIKVMKELIKTNKKVKLLLPGEDELNGYYQKITKNYGLEDYIKFLGNRDDIPKLLKISNIGVSSSKREGLPVNIIECLISGLPVISTNCRGTNDLIEDCKNGFVVPINNVNIFINRIEDIYNNRFDYKIMKEYNQEKKKKINIENVQTSIKKMYKRKKCIIHLLSSNSFSGAENVACLIIKMFEKDYDIFYCSPRGPIVENLKEKHIKYIPLDNIKLAAVKKIIKDYNPDIIHAHDIRASVVASLFKKKNRKIISHIHCNIIKMKNFRLKSFFLLMSSLFIDKIIWVSNYSLRNFTFLRFIKKKSIVFENIIDKNYIYQKSKEKFNKKYDIIFIGRIVDEKNPIKMLKVISHIKKKKKNIKVAVIGDGILYEQMIGFINDSDLTDNIDLYGFLQNPYKILSHSKIMLMTSKTEGFPMVILEALSLGIPIVSTPVGEIPNIISNEIGFLSNNDISLGNKIIDILSDQKKYSVLSNNALKKFNKINDYDIYTEEIKKIYEN